MEELKKLYEYLDGFTFVGTFEVYGAVQDYFSENGERQLSYGEVALCERIADKYISQKGLEFEDEE